MKDKDSIPISKVEEIKNRLWEWKPDYMGRNDMEEIIEIIESSIRKEAKRE